MTRHKLIPFLIFFLIGLLELGDFAGNLTTAISPELFYTTAARLGITPLGEALRLLFLLPVTVLITLSSLAVAWGIWRDTKAVRFWKLVAGLNILYALFVIGTGVLLWSLLGFAGILYILFAGLAYWSGQRINP